MHRSFLMSKEIRDFLKNSFQRREGISGSLAHVGGTILGMHSRDMIELLLAVRRMQQQLLHFIDAQGHLIPSESSSTCTPCA